MEYHRITSKKTGNIFTVKTFIGFFHRIMIGRNKNICLHIHVYPDEDDCYHAELQALGYDEGCVVNGFMTRGDGTKDLLNAAREFIKHRYDFVLAFTYKDTSYTECHNNLKVDMMFPSICKYRTNWYSHYFSGAPLFENGVSLLKEVNDFLDTKITINYSDFMDIIADVPNKNTDIYNKILRFILPIYEKYYNGQKTYREFIAYVYRSECVYVAYWLKPFLKHINQDFMKLTSQVWIIPIKDTSYDIDYSFVSEQEYLMLGGYVKDYIL
jgi:hypothetical protein